MKTTHGSEPERDGELDLGEIGPGRAPGARRVRPGVHPWSTSQIKEYEEGDGEPED